MKRNLIFFFSILSIPGLAQMPGVMMQIDTDNAVAYNYDVADRANWGRLAGPIAAAPSPPAWGTLYIVADIVAVNGKPAKGVSMGRITSLNLRPAPTPGQAISDVNRTGVIDVYLDFLADDGTSIGSIMGSGLVSGARPPGSPLDFPGGNSVTITGGTGAYLGMRGQISGLALLPNGRGTRGASITEDPANRRALGGGGILRANNHLLPLTRPEIVSVFHSDFTSVSASSPARAGEILIASATGLGPTRPGLDPEQPFPESPAQEVNSPLDVTVNGQAAVVFNKVGWPGTTGSYRVDFRVPDGTAAGMATVQMSAAFISGPAMRFPVR